MENGSIDIMSHKRYNFLQFLNSQFCHIFDSLESNKLDLSDFGNSLGNFLREECDKDMMGFTIKDFINGLQHGLYISTINTDLKNPNNIELEKIQRTLREFEAEHMTKEHIQKLLNK